MTTQVVITAVGATPRARSTAGARSSRTRSGPPAVRFGLLGDDALTGGVGGWEFLDRPRRTAAVEWVGTPGYQLVLPLVLDGTEVRRGVDVSVEAQCRIVTAWGRPAGDGPPPVLTVAGPLRIATASRWVLDDVEWGRQIRNRAGQRILQEVTLTLLQHVAASVIASPAGRARDRNKGKKKKKKPPRRVGRR